MKTLKKASLAILCVCVAACASQNESYQDEFLQDEVRIIEDREPSSIALENLQTRVVAYCHDSAVFSAEECALDLERRGFVRLTDIPKVTADKDFLTTGTYPTRRWRETDRIPRW